MLDINFVPDDYIKSNESRRMNLIYLALLLLVMVVLIGLFVTVKVQQRLLATKEKILSAKIAQEKDRIMQVEELQVKRNTIWKTALTATDLIESVPRSVLLASLTNNLPAGVSLLRLNLVQKESKVTDRLPPKTNNDGKQKTSKDKPQSQKYTIENPEEFLETHIDIEGIAPSDLQVASYIEQLSNSVLLDNVLLVESKERGTSPGVHSDKLERQKQVFRQFKLTAVLKKQVHLTDEDMARIRVLGQKVVSNF